MTKVNQNFLELQGSYLFATIAKKEREYRSSHKDAPIIRLGIGDVTQGLAPTIVDALRKAALEMRSKKTFHGYAPDLGYEFLRSAIAKKDFAARGVSIDLDEIFISDGAKSDSGNIGDIFAVNNKVAVCDPVYPVYVDTNVMAGRAGTYNAATGRYSKLIYMPCNEKNGFRPKLPKTVPDILYLCFPNNPTGAVLTKEELQQWVDYANLHKSVIIFDAAYESYISDESIPHSIFECDNAKTCAIEIRSFSKSAGFTGTRLGYTVIPKELVFDGVSLNSLWARRQGTKFNGAPYIIQRAGEAVYSEEGQKQVHYQIGVYMKNAKKIREDLLLAGYTVSGGEHAPYIWLRTPKGMTSWEFFDCLLTRANVIGTPGSGFGPNGEGYFRLSAFSSYRDTTEAVKRIAKLELI